MRRQLDRCIGFATRNGLLVEPSLVFQDIGSGLEQSRRRPGYRALMGALSAHQAEVLIVDELSRLSRSLPELLATLKELDAIGVQVLVAEESPCSSAA